jgi:hypothetical protein
MKTVLNFYKLLLIVGTTIAVIIFDACKAGPGGKSSVSGTVYHHTRPITTCIVYIKYGATEFPGTDVSTYDASVKPDAKAHYEFDNLRMGNYFLYGVGYDSVVMAPVSGGVGIKLKYDKASTTDVPITE